MKVIKFILSIIVISFISISCSNNHQPKIVDSISKDTIKLDSIDNGDIEANMIYEISKSLSTTKDSLNHTKDSLDIYKIKLNAATRVKDSITKVNIINKEKLATAEYKLLRIREYNRIAAQGNNVKFLRSWINRVINK